MEPTELSSYIETALDVVTHDAVAKSVLSIAIVLGLLLLRRLVLRYVETHTENSQEAFRWRKTSGYLVALLSVLLLSPLWLGTAGHLATYLGLASAGMVIVLKEPISNVAGFLLIVIRQPFGLGDRIQIGAIKGDIIDQRLFEFTMFEVGNWVDSEQSTGRIVHIPNGLVLSTPVFNYTQGFTFLWNEIEIPLTFESNWPKAKEILQRIADEQTAHLAPVAEAQMRQASGRYLIAIGKLTPKVYTRVRPNGVALTLRYLTPVRSRRTSEEALTEALLLALAREPDVRFAYPTQRVTLDPRGMDPPTGNSGTTTP